MKGIHIIGIFIVLLAVVFAYGCSKSNDSSATDTDASGSSAGASSSADSQENLVAQLRDIEITPSGDANCFLSPCDCVCYAVKNVPVRAKKPTCGINCNSEYKVTGCRFTNYQCFSIR